LVAQTQSADNYLRQGQEKLQNEEYKRAIIDFTISLEIEVSIEAYLGRASAKRMLDDFAGAMEDYNSAIELDKKNPILYNNRGNLKDEAGKPAEAILDYDQALRLDSLYQNAYYNRAIAKYNMQDFAGAKNDFEKVLQTQADDQDALLGLALTENKLNNKSKACAYFVRLSQLGFRDAEDYLQKYCQ
jgi:Tfp pilus assembly protein PilF